MQTIYRFLRIAIIACFAISASSCRGVRIMVAGLSGPVYATDTDFIIKKVRPSPVASDTVFILAAGLKYRIVDVDAGTNYIKMIPSVKYQKGVTTTKIIRASGGTRISTVNLIGAVPKLSRTSPIQPQPAPRLTPQDEQWDAVQVAQTQATQAQTQATQAAQAAQVAQTQATQAQAQATRAAQAVQTLTDPASQPQTEQSPNQITQTAQAVQVQAAQAQAQATQATEAARVAQSQAAQAAQAAQPQAAQAAPLEYHIIPTSGELYSAEEKDIKTYQRVLVCQIALGTMLLPIKIRRPVEHNGLKYQRQFATDISLGPYIGYRFKMTGNNYKTFTTVGLFAGPTLIDYVSTTSQTGSPINGTNPDNMFAFTYGLGLVHEIDGFQIGLVYGADKVSGKRVEEWPYDGKGWFSLGIGYNFLAARTAQ